MTKAPTTPTKEQQLRALRESRADPTEIPTFLKRGHPECVVKTSKPAPGPRAATQAPVPAAPVTAKEPKGPAPVPAPAPEHPAPAEPTKETSTMRTKTNQRASKAKARTPVKAKAKTSSGKSKIDTIAALLKRPGGCTSKDVLKATGWPAVSMPAMAKAAGLKLKKEKPKGAKETIYSAA